MWKFVVCFRSCRIWVETRRRSAVLVPLEMIVRAFLFCSDMTLHFFSVPLAGDHHGSARESVPGWCVLLDHPLPHRLSVQAAQGLFHLLSLCVALKQNSLALFLSFHVVWAGLKKALLKSCFSAMAEYFVLFSKRLETDN
jgi:hypothetical protein